MPRATAEEVKKLEATHKIQFASLVIANNLWLAMPGKYGFNPKDTTTKKYQSWIDLGHTIAKLAGAWGARQLKLESLKGANIEKIPKETYTDFLQKSKQKFLSDLALKLVKVDPGAKGIGFIPLLIWGVVIIIAALSAAYIVDETTTTAQEKEELLQQTEKTLKDLNIPPDKAAEIIKDTQHDASENKGVFQNLTGGGFGSLLPIGIVALLFMGMNKNKK